MFFKKDKKKLNIEDYNNTCASCKLVTLDNDENYICYATGKLLGKNKDCDCNAYEFSNCINSKFK